MLKTINHHNLIAQIDCEKNEKYKLQAIHKLLSLYTSEISTTSTTSEFFNKQEYSFESLVSKFFEIFEKVYNKDSYEFELNKVSEYVYNYYLVNDENNDNLIKYLKIGKDNNCANITIKLGNIYKSRNEIDSMLECFTQAKKCGELYGSVLLANYYKEICDYEKLINEYEYIIDYDHLNNYFNNNNVYKFSKLEVYNDTHQFIIDTDTYIKNIYYELSLYYFGKVNCEELCKQYAKFSQCKVCSYYDYKCNC